MIDRDEDKLPLIGGELNDDLNRHRLVKASRKFLRLLYAEKLTAIREECPDERQI